MAYDSQLVHNSAVLFFFEDLQNNHLEPEISLFLGRRLVITSYKPNGILEVIYQIFLECQVALLDTFGFLEESEEKIEAIKERVAQYHFDNCADLREKELEESICDLMKENKALRRKIDWIHLDLRENKKVEDSLALLKQMDDFKQSQG